MIQGDQINRRIRHQWVWRRHRKGCLQKENTGTRKSSRLNRVSFDVDTPQLSVGGNSTKVQAEVIWYLLKHVRTLRLIYGCLLWYRLKPIMKLILLQMVVRISEQWRRNGWLWSTWHCCRYKKKVFKAEEECFFCCGHTSTLWWWKFY